MGDSVENKDPVRPLHPNIQINTDPTLYRDYRQESEINTDD